MGWLDQIVDLNSGKPINPNGAYASYFPLYEQQTPQYPYPNPYSLAQYGYRHNELIYACVSKRAKAIAEPPCQVSDNSGETPEAKPDHELSQLIRTPIRLEDGTVKLTEKSFWRATETYLCVAGFAAWEMELNNLGKPINLWPMRPDWCSFRRGANNPLEYIRYQPYGLPFMDIPASRILLFQYFDPIYPLLKALSPSAVANRVTAVDNATTDFLKIFFERGAVINGLLKTDQTLQDAEAMRYRQLWQQQHGGVANWADVAVLGSGLDYKQTQMNFRDMQFDAIDGRDEARICMAFETPPILVGAKVGLDRSTFSNYGEARRAWYEEWTMPEWDWLDSELEAQLLPKFEPVRYSVFTVGFNLSKVKALQEDEDLKHARAREDARLNLITRDEARTMIGFDPIDNAQTFVGQAAPALGEEPLTREEKQEDQEEMFGGNDESDKEDAAKELERKQFKQFIKNGYAASEFHFKYLSKREQIRLRKGAQRGDNGTPFQGNKD